MSPLDDPQTYERLDPTGMRRRIGDLPVQCEAAWRRGVTFRLPRDYRRPDHLVVLGMGGSAIGGDLLRALAALESPAPVVVVRGYHLPPIVTRRSLVVACSYSGATEETLSAFQEALTIPCRKLAITTGGPLAAAARANGVPLLQFEYPAEPRAALGWLFLLLAGVAHQVGVISDLTRDLDEALGLMEELLHVWRETVPTPQNTAKGLAQRLHGRLPVLFGAGFLSAVARRWKTQLNENAKVWAVAEELPEADHNAIVGFSLPRQVASQVTGLFLRSPALHPRVLLRYTATQDALRGAGAAAEEVHAHGRSPLAQMLTTILCGDYVSYYLAILNGVDPSPVPAIEALKARLAKE